MSDNLLSQAQFEDHMIGVEAVSRAIGTALRAHDRARCAVLTEERRYLAAMSQKLRRGGGRPRRRAAR